MSTNIQTVEPSVQMAQTETAAIIGMIERAATNPNVDVEKFARLLEMRERVEAQFAKKAFNAAISRAKGEIGPIFKDKLVDFSTQRGRTNYRFEGFDSVARAVDPVLNRYGLSYRFRATQSGGKLSLTCILSHADGYSEETTLEASEDTSGNKNAIQAVGSAATYLQRYTLKLALGLATSLDDDAQAVSRSEPETGVISEEQATRLRELCRKVGTPDAETALARYFNVTDIADLPSNVYDRAVKATTKKVKEVANG